jgi:hypothetical protein
VVSASFNGTSVNPSKPVSTSDLQTCPDFEKIMTEANIN